MEAQTFGTALRELRRKAGVSQRELAARVNVDFSYISKLENDRIPPPAADTVVAICQALNAPSTELLALIGKLPSDVEKAVATVPEAQAFLREVQLMNLSEAEWQEIQGSLKQLKDERDQ
jgi:HTH-type transcriptional regulator, competence development regulator